MNALAMEWLNRALAADAPAPPALWLAQLWLHLGWSVVLAWLGAVVGGRWFERHAVPLGIAVVLAAWTWLPGDLSPAYWLGLAFQAPSLLLVLLCACGLWSRVSGHSGGRLQGWLPSTRVPVLAVAGVLLGSALVLDSFAVLPVQLYAWGFSPLAAAALLMAALLPWVLARHAQVPRVVAWAPAVAVLLFVALRLPSGNAWDAVLDPWLWLALQVWLVRTLWNRY